MFKHTDPVAGTEMQTETTGEISPYGVGRVEREALGAVIPTQEPEIQEPPHSFGKGGSIGNPETGCELNYAPVSCQFRDNYLAARGHLFAGSQIVVNIRDTYRERHIFRRAPGVEGPHPSWERENYLRTEWNHIGSTFEFVTTSPGDLNRRFADEAADKKKLPLFERHVLREKVSNAMSQKCKDFISKLLNKANEISSSSDAKRVQYGDILAVFDTVAKQGGFYGSISANISTVRGSVAGGSAAVYLAGYNGWDAIQSAMSKFANITPKAIRNSYNQSMEKQALITIHELLHFSYGDATLARAVAAINEDTKSTFASETAGSPYWNTELQKQCDPTYSPAKYGRLK